MAQAPTADRPTQLADRLRSGVTPSGAGWGYQRANRPRPEPTCWTLLALRESLDWTPAEWQAFSTPHFIWLASLQRSDGFVTEVPDGPVNLGTNGLVAFTTLALQASPLRLPALLDVIVATKGVALPSDGPQNNGLQGWPFVADTFSWIEPTAWCALALKLARRRGVLPREGADRIAVADQLLENRMCATGGWNYGNATMLGQDLRAYVTTTAIALIALQDLRDRPFVTRSVQYLSAQRRSEPSSLALGLAALALRLHGVNAADLDGALIEASGRRDAADSNFAMAVALLALSAPRHQGRAFHVA